ncbi:MAG: hypothetical protein HON43_00465 [Alphaproteobacteria bacterium]|jgi:hypothetical protein|nr:hypothetical protein [Alphaproteobacteria bacterium]MBT5390538.1 hypothetical protein [Alphaproteobacteria bacterium]
MSYFSINGLIGFFDLRNIIIENSLDRRACILEKELPYGIKFSFFNNCYYFFDFSEADFAKPFLDLKNLDEFKNAKNSVTLHLQKEMINAFNAYLYINYRELNKSIHYSSSVTRSQLPNDIDQFFIPNSISKVTLPLSYYLDSCAIFSSEAYKIASKAVYSQNPHNNRKFSKKLISKSVGMLSSISEHNQIDPYNQAFFYILAQLWKAVYFKNHDLRIEATIFARCIFELLVQRKFGLKNKGLTKARFNKYCESKEVSSFFKDFYETLRNPSAHELRIPEKPDEINQYLKYLIEFFKRDSGIDIKNILR